MGSRSRSILDSVHTEDHQVQVQRGCWRQMGRFLFISPQRYRSNYLSQPGKPHRTVGTRVPLYFTGALLDVTNLFEDIPAEHLERHGRLETALSLEQRGVAVTGATAQLHGSGGRVVVNGEEGVLRSHVAPVAVVVVDATPDEGFLERVGR